MSVDKSLEEMFSETLGEVKKACARYNKLIEKVLETVDRDYTSVYGLKRAILETISKQLHEHD